MTTVFEKLRLTREARGMSLEDIAAITRIQTKILKALEEGNVSIVPDAYVRAFLKTYAKEVGLSETEILRDYEQQRAVAQAPRATQQQVPRSPKKTEVRKNGIRVSQTTLLAVIAGVIVLSFVVSLSLSDGGEKANDVQEIPFHEVVKQQERRSSKPTSDSGSVSAPKTVEGKDRAAKPPSPQLPPGDSLVLRAMTFDSVWIRVGIDGKFHREYIVPPRWNGQWKAADRFVVSVNNASAVSFILNNAPLGIVGQPGEPVRNYLIQRRDVSRLPTQTEEQ